MSEAGARNIGAEILEGIRELKRGEIGRAATFPPVAEKRQENLTADQLLKRIVEEDLK